MSAPISASPIPPSSAKGGSVGELSCFVSTIFCSVEAMPSLSLSDIIVEAILLFLFFFFDSLPAFVSILRFLLRCCSCSSSTEDSESASAASSLRRRSFSAAFLSLFFFLRFSPPSSSRSPCSPLCDGRRPMGSEGSSSSSSLRSLS